MPLLKSTLLFFFLAVRFALPAQIWDRTEAPKPGVPNFTLRTVHPLIGMNGEYRLYGGLTAFATVNTSLFSSRDREGKMFFATPAYLQTGFNWYHNFERRKELGKDVSYFAGNFISLSATQHLWKGRFGEFNGYPYEYHPSPALNLSYNIRRNFGKNRRFYVESGLGLSVGRSLRSINNSGFELSPLLNLKIGINLK